MLKIFICPSEAGNALRQCLVDDQSSEGSNEMNRVKTIFASCGLAEIFIFIESGFFDKSCNEELIRICAILRCGL